MTIANRTGAQLDIPIPPLKGDYDPSNTIEYLGTRYYAIEAPTTPLTGTLEVTFRLDDLANLGAYDVTFLDMIVDKSTKAPRIVRSAVNIAETASNVFRAPNFGGDDRRVVVAVSKVADVDSARFDLDVHLTSRDTQPVASPNIFSPNGDGRKDSTTFSYFLPPFPSTTTTNNDYRVNAFLADPGKPAQLIGSATQPMSQTQTFTWDTQSSQIPMPADDLHTLEFRAQEFPDGQFNGNTHAYTATVTIDTKAPPPATSLQFTPNVGPLVPGSSYPKVVETEPVSTSATQNRPSAIVPGIAGEMVIATTYTIYVDGKWMRLPAGSLTGPGTAFFTSGNDFAELDGLGMGAIVGVPSAAQQSADYGSLWYTPNYQTTAPSKKLSGQPWGVASNATMAQDAVYVSGSDGVYKVTNVSGTPVVTRVVADSNGIRWVRADRQTHTAVAAYNTQRGMIYLRPAPGAAWQTITLPESGDSLGDRIEVIGG